MRKLAKSTRRTYLKLVKTEHMNGPMKSKRFTNREEMFARAPEKFKYLGFMIFLFYVMKEGGIMNVNEFV